MASSQEMQPSKELGEISTINVEELTIANEIQPTFDPDVVALARAGKRQVLERRFGLLSMTGFSASLMCTWESMLVVFLLGYTNGGPGGLVYGFIFIWLGNLSVFTAMGELASMVPTASGQYHWVNHLAPPNWRNFMSYLTGWITVAGWVAAITAGAFFTSTLAQGLAVLNDSSYAPTGWQTTLILWATILVCAVLNTLGSRVLPAIEILILVLHVLGFLAIIIPLLTLAPKNSASDVFTSFYNLGGYSTFGLSFFIGLNGNATAFVGTDGPVHMSEEVKNARKNVPRSMILSLVINGVLTLGLLLAVLFCAVDLDNATQNAPDGFPFMLILAQGIGSVPGATVMGAIVLVLEFCSTAGSMAAASRMMWSFARDQGLPGYRWLKRVDPLTTVPLNTVLIVCVCAALLSMIAIGSATAFNGAVSLVLEAFYLSYLLAIGLLLYRRVRGDIVDPDSAEAKTAKYVWGPWRFNNIFGLVNNVAAIAYLLILMLFSFFPSSVPVTAATMNYSVLVLGAVTLFSIAYYVIWARRTYEGPVIEVKVHEL